MIFLLSELPVGVELVLHGVEHLREEPGEESVDGQHQNADDNNGYDDSTDGIGGQVALDVLNKVVDAGLSGQSLSLSLLKSFFMWFYLLELIKIVELVLTNTMST